MGAADQQELQDLIRPMNLQGSGEADRLPAAGGPRPAGSHHSLRANPTSIWAEARSPKSASFFRAGDHGCVNIGEARPLIGDWIAQKILA